MVPSQQIYDMFSQLVGYPGDEHGRRIAEYRRLFLAPAIGAEQAALSANEVIGSVRQFFDETEALLPGDMEELYTRTFDINPVASLELGWHLYGEQYERGAFLVKMRQMLHKHFIEEAVELPDHLLHVLLLLGRMEKQDADHLAVTYVLPALDKILEGFAEVENPYKNLLRSLRIFIQQQHVSTGPIILEGAASHE